MADLTITAANVKPAVQSADVQVVKWGETVTEGQVVYQNTSDYEYYLADADAVGTAKAVGITLTAGADGEYGVIQKSGDIDIGATLTVGATYVVSTTAGGIAPIADLGSGDFVTILGVADAADNLPLDINKTGTAKA